METHVQLVRDGSTIFAVVDDEHFRSIGEKRAAQLGRSDEMKIQEFAAGEAKRELFETLERETDAFAPGVNTEVAVKSELPITV